MGFWNSSSVSVFDFDNAAQLNRLPYPPPYLGLLAERKQIPKTGVNFASGSSGILPDTGAVSYISLLSSLPVHLDN